MTKILEFGIWKGAKKANFEQFWKSTFFSMLSFPRAIYFCHFFWFLKKLFLVSTSVWRVLYNKSEANTKRKWPKAKILKTESKRANHVATKKFFFVRNFCGHRNFYSFFWVPIIEHQIFEVPIMGRKCFQNPPINGTFFVILLFY